METDKNNQADNSIHAEFGIAYTARKVVMYEL